MGLRSFCAVSSVFLKGSWSFARVRGAVFGSARVVLVSNAPATPAISTLTGCNPGPSCREQVNGLLHIGDARREVCAALEKLHLLPEVVHGGGRRPRSGTGYGASFIPRLAARGAVTSEPQLSGQQRGRPLSMAVVLA